MVTGNSMAMDSEARMQHARDLMVLKVADRRFGCSRRPWVVSGSGSVVVTSGSCSVTEPLTSSVTLLQMPVLRPRMVDIQSQPADA